MVTPVIMSPPAAHHSLNLKPNSLPSPYGLLKAQPLGLPTQRAKVAHSVKEYEINIVEYGTSGYETVEPIVRQQQQGYGLRVQELQGI